MAVCSSASLARPILDLDGMPRTLGWELLIWLGQLHLMLSPAQSGARVIVGLSVQLLNATYD